MKLWSAFFCLCPAFLCGCAFPHKETSYYRGYNHVPTQREERFCSMTLEPAAEMTTFRATAGHIIVPTVLAHPMKHLQFSIPNDDIISGRALQLADLAACSVGIGYNPGAGLISTGKVTVGSVGRRSITLTIESPELDPRLCGTREFLRAWPGKKGRHAMVIRHGLVKAAETAQPDR